MEKHHACVASVPPVNYPEAELRGIKKTALLWGILEQARK